MIMTESDLALLDQAMERWGIDAQLDQASEECAEFIVARSHYRRTRGTGEQLFEEAADTYITMMQVRQLAPEQFDECVRIKMARLAGLLKINQQ